MTFCSEASSAFVDSVVAMHSNICMSAHPRTILRMLLASFFPSTVSAEDAPKVFPISSFWSYVLEETGYLHLQATKPDTVGNFFTNRVNPENNGAMKPRNFLSVTGIGLTHSPSGLAAYILEKFSSGTNAQNKQREDGGLTSKFTMDELLDNIMIYWVTGSITTSIRLYSEQFGSTEWAYGLDRYEEKYLVFSPLHS